MSFKPNQSCSATTTAGKDVPSVPLVRGLNALSFYCIKQPALRSALILVYMCAWAHVQRQSRTYTLHLCDGRPAAPQMQNTSKALRWVVVKTHILLCLPMRLHDWIGKASH